MQGTHGTRGTHIASGRTSEVYAFGESSVVKVLHPDVPRSWAALEAQLTEAVTRQGVRAPEVRDVLEVDGRPAIEFERIEGPSLWQMMVDEPDDIDRLAEVFADVHRTVLRAGPPAGVPDVVERLCRKIEDVSMLEPAERSEGQAITRSLPRGAALLHGDLHPANVLMSTGGPVIIDWFDCAIGHPVADVVRTSILLRPSANQLDLPHLPGARSSMLTRLLERYLGNFVDELAAERDRLARWRSVLAAGRLAEGAQADSSMLLELWNARNYVARDRSSSGSTPPVDPARLPRSPQPGR